MTRAFTPAETLPTHSQRPALLQVGSVARLASLGLLGAAFAYQLGWAWLASVPQIVGSVTNDDTFLYLEFARNTVVFGFPTFDGMHVTNGVQPLWAGILVLLAALTDDKVLLLRWLLSVCAVLNVGTGLVLLRVATRLQSRVLAGVVGVCWTWYMLGLKPAMLGMENSLHAFIAALVVLHLAGFLTRSSLPGWRQYLVFGVLLALNAGARLDSAVISLVLGLAVVYRGATLGTRHRTALLCVLGPSLLGAGAYYLFNAAYFGSGLPVSGAMKAYYAQQYFHADDAWQRPLYVLAAVAKPLFDAPQWILAKFAPEGVESWWLGVVLVVVLTPLLLRFAAPRLVDRPTADGPLAKLCRLLLTATLVHMVVLGISILHFAVDAWYHSWLILTWILVLGWGLERWLKSPVLKPGARVGIVTAMVVLLAVTKGIALHRQLTGREAVPLYDARLEVANWINHNLPVETTLAAWNAGQLAYFTDQALINLDGLMNSPEYASFIQAGGDVRQKVDELGVDVVVDYNADDSSIPDHRVWDAEASFRGLWRWDEVVVLHRHRSDDGTEFYVLKLRATGDLATAGRRARRASVNVGRGDHPRLVGTTLKINARQK